MPIAAFTGKSQQGDEGLIEAPRGVSRTRTQELFPPPRFTVAPRGLQIVGCNGCASFNPGDVRPEEAPSHSPVKLGHY